VIRIWSVDLASLYGSLPGMIVEGMRLAPEVSSPEAMP